LCIIELISGHVIPEYGGLRSPYAEVRSSIEISGLESPSIGLPYPGGPIWHTPQQLTPYGYEGVRSEDAILDEVAPIRNEQNYVGLTVDNIGDRIGDKFVGRNGVANVGHGYDSFQCPIRYGRDIMVIDDSGTVVGGGRRELYWHMGSFKDKYISMDGQCVVDKDGNEVSNRYLDCEGHILVNSNGDIIGERMYVDDTVCIRGPSFNHICIREKPVSYFSRMWYGPYSHMKTVYININDAYIQHVCMPVISNWIQFSYSCGDWGDMSIMIGEGYGGNFLGNYNYYFMESSYMGSVGYGDYSGYRILAGEDRYRNILVGMFSGNCDMLPPWGIELPGIPELPIAPESPGFPGLPPIEPPYPGFPPPIEPPYPGFPPPIEPPYPGFPPPIGPDFGLPGFPIGPESGYPGLPIGPDFGRPVLPYPLTNMEPYPGYQSGTWDRHNNGADGHQPQMILP